MNESSEEFSYLDLAYFDPLTSNPKNKRTENYNDIPYFYEKKTKELPISLNMGPIDSAWPMQSHDQNHSGLSPYPTASNPGIEKWRFKTHGSVDSGIAIDTDGTLYFGDFSGWLYALYPDGSLKWEHEAMAHITLEMPCIANNGIIYIGSHARLQAWDRNGTRLWSIGVGGNIGSSPAVADDGTIYVGHMNNDMCAVYPNGTIKWKYTTGSWIACDPTIHPDGTIIFGSSDTYIYALHPNGTLRWRYKTGEIVRGHASIDDQGIIYMSCWDGYLYSFDVNGTLKKKFDMPIAGGETMAFGPDGTIYVTYDGLAAIDPSDWTVKWKFNYLEDDEKAYLSSPAVSADAIIYIGTQIDDGDGGQIYSIKSDGTLRWNKKVTNRKVASSPGISEDGSIYIGSAIIGDVSFIGSIHAFGEPTSNEPPYPPEFVGNLIKWAVGENIYKFRGYDPDNNPIQFFIDWGNGRTTGWTREYAPGEILEIPFIYITPGRHNIKFKTRDILEEESEWTHVTVRLPYTYNSPVQWWNQSHFPLLSKLQNFFNNLLTT
jgi:outer membrane protein assembly factor BamB